MNGLPEVTGKRTLSNSFLTGTTQVCIVTRDHRKCMENFVRLGIGPWRIYTFDKSTMEKTTLHGKPADFSMKICLAWTGSTNWEIIEPLEGPSLYHEFLETHGEGIHHVAVGADGLDHDEQIAEFERRGFSVSQSGEVQGSRFAYFDTENATHATFEIIKFARGAANTGPDEWYPAPPP